MQALLHQLHRILPFWLYKHLLFLFKHFFYLSAFKHLFSWKADSWRERETDLPLLAHDLNAMTVVGSHLSQRPGAYFRFPTWLQLFSAIFPCVCVCVRRELDWKQNWGLKVASIGLLQTLCHNSSSQFPLFICKANARKKESDTDILLAVSLTKWL